MRIIIRYKSIPVILLFTAFLITAAANADTKDSEKENSAKQVIALSPQASRDSLVLQDGFIAELVAHEPMVEEPVLLTFDGNGRMYVAEMLTYMLDADGTDQMSPVSRIKRLEDTDNDGVVDTSTIFAENLLLPRMILTLEEGKILVRETNTFDLLLLEDTDGDGISDKRTTVFEGGPRGGNLEHQPSGLIWGIDNWLYVTYTNQRYRVKDGKVIRREMRYGGGQWGLGQDETGRLYYSSAGAENPVFSFQYPSVYGMIPVDGETAEGFDEVFPIENIPDVQGGKSRLRADNTLNHFTGIAGQSVYLGDKLPEIYGNYIAPEPVGNLIRRANIKRQDGYSVISHPYQQSKKEFLATTDSAFRPVWSETAPDGTLYVVDMYRGIVQEANWTQSGTYLRDIIDQYGLANVVGRGRIYRITKPNVIRDSQPSMYEQTPQQLVQYLSHPNQWWRINAQKYIVLSQDKSVVPTLIALVKEAENPLARLHALWALEGLGAIDIHVLKQALKDTSSNVQVAAIRISEQLFSKDDMSIVALWETLIPTADIELAQQIFLSIFYVDTPLVLRTKMRDQILAKYPNKKGLLAINQAIVYQLKEKEKEQALAQGNLALAQSLKRGAQNFKSLCASCHGANGAGTPAGEQLIAPSFHNNPRVMGNLAILGRTVLDGLIGPIDGQTYVGGMMASIGSNDDEWIADVLTYIRNNFGNSASMVTPEQIQRLKAMEQRSQPWSLDDLNTHFGKKLINKQAWIFSASHNNKDFGAIVDGKADWAKWDSDSLQSIGMWLQVELPNVYRISQINMDCRKWNWRCARAFDVSFSLDGDNWTIVDTNIETDAVRLSETLGQATKYIRFTLKNGSPKESWVVTELDLYGSAVGE